MIPGSLDPTTGSWYRLWNFPLSLSFFIFPGVSQSNSNNKSPDNSHFLYCSILWLSGSAFLLAQGFGVRVHQLCVSVSHLRNILILFYKLVVV